MKRQETGKFGEGSQWQIRYAKGQRFVSPMTRTAVFSSRTTRIVTSEESPTQGGFSVTNSPDFIFLLIPSPHRSVSTACLPESWQENEIRRMSSSPCRYLFRLQTRLPRSGDSAGRRVPYQAQQNPAVQFNLFFRPGRWRRSSLT